MPSGLRLVEAYKYTLIPRQDDPVGEITFDVSNLDQQGSVAQRASRRSSSDGNLAAQFPAVMLRLKLTMGSLKIRWADGHVTAAVLWEDFAKYVYLPRLRDQEVHMTSCKAATGPASTTWQPEGFAVRWAQMLSRAGTSDLVGRFASGHRCIPHGPARTARVRGRTKMKRTNRTSSRTGAYDQSAALSGWAQRRRRRP